MGQFIYNRILNRLISQYKPNGGNSTTPYPNTSTTTTTTTTISPSNTTIFNTTISLISSLASTTLSPSNKTDACNYINNTNTSNLTSNMMTFYQHVLSPMCATCFDTRIDEQIVNINPYYTSNWNDASGDWTPTPDEMDRIRTQAQMDTAHLYFVSALFTGIPVIIMTNILGVNCSTLGRKTLMLIYLATMTLKFLLILLQCVYVDWPDWLFYVGAFAEGISGSTGVFYLSLYCFIADFTSPGSRSYRITLLNSLNSMANLSVTFLCGYVIKWYGYFYLFLVSLVLMATSLVYTIFLIPEPLVELRDKSILERLKLCSLKRTVDCLTVYSVLLSNYSILF